MQVTGDISTMREQISEWKLSGLKIAFVPTMGNLHQGHLSLVEHAKRHGDKVIASIFVNPMQFGANEDLDNYPRTMRADCDALKQLGVDLVFTPTDKVIYPKSIDVQTYVEVPELGNIICGESRPVHFRGVTTVVCKLFNLVQPDVACFGEKDFQQLFLIKAMVDDLSIPVEVIGVPTVREASGLAMSSRNGYLNDEEKKQASVLFKSLNFAKNQIEAGRRDYDHIKHAMRDNINAAGLRTDYIEIRNADTLMEANDQNQHFVVLVSGYLGGARLIDNIHFSV